METFFFFSFFLFFFFFLSFLFVLSIMISLKKSIQFSSIVIILKQTNKESSKHNSAMS